jgi:CxxC motif-containing protein (DUF1111 family)
MKLLVTASSILLVSSSFACSSSNDEAASQDPSTGADVSVAVAAEGTGVHVNTITEAPTGFDDLTNGFATQADMDAALSVFSEIKAAADGLGPLYDGQSCRECHRNPVTGGGSQVTVVRVGHFDGTSFVDPPGGSQISAFAIAPAFQEHVPVGSEVQTSRLSLSLFGDGFVEAIDSNTLSAISIAQPAAQRGTLIQVPVLEAGNAVRVGRFGWKDQHASLLSCSASEYLDEEGITSPLQPRDNTLLAQGGTASDGVPDPEISGDDLAQVALFLRSLKAPPRGPTTAAVTRGQTNFTSVGCAVCHVATITTAPVGTVSNGGAFTVPAALGDKAIHPFGDYLLHNIGTGDGIVQNGGQGTRNMVRTAPLWGIHARTRFMHDGASATVTAAISRHGGQASAARTNFNALSAAGQSDLLAFVNSL